jgi:hypothetical protein
MCGPLRSQRGTGSAQTQRLSERPTNERDLICSRSSQTTNHVEAMSAEFPYRRAWEECEDGLSKLALKKLCALVVCFFCEAGSKRKRSERNTSTAISLAEIGLVSALVLLPIQSPATLGV